MSVFRYQEPEAKEPNTEPEKGIVRLFTILSHNLGRLLKVNLLVLLCILPAQILIWLLLSGLLHSGQPLFWLLGVALAFASSLLVGPAVAAGSSVVSKIVRGVPICFWRDYRAAFKDGFRQTAVFGFVFTLLTNAQFPMILIYDEYSGGGIILACYLVAILLFHMVWPYFFLQASYMELGAGSLLKNSLLLALGNAPKTLLCALIQLVFWLAAVLFFPVSAVPLVLFGYALPVLLGMTLIWPIVDSAFEITQKLLDRANSILDGGIDNGDA